jgi:PAS domain S-box-containing protein
MVTETPEPNDSTAIAFARSDETILWAGTGFPRLLGLASANVVGLRLRDLLGTAGHWPSKAFDLAATTATRQVSRTELPLNGAGSRVLKLTFEPVAGQGGELPPLVIIAQHVADDISSQVQAQAERYQLIFQNSLDGILYGTENGPILEANPAACQMLGASAEELRKMRRQDVTDLSDPRLPERLMERRRNGTARGVLTMIRMDGTRFECELSSSVWQSVSGETEAVTLMRDLTERQALESKVRELKRLESLGTLAGGLAHDFNNIVAVIVGNVVLARAEADAGHSTLPMLEQIDKAAERARLLVEHLMVFSQKRHQNLVLQKLGPILERGLTTLRTTLPNTLHIRPSLSEEALYARVDEDGLHQVLINLGTNSAQAMSEGHGTVDVLLDRVDLEYAEVERLGGTAAGAYARIRVRDDGCGFDDAIRERLFDPFFTTRQLGKSTGMGLAIAHSIIRDHGGMISAVGSPGSGAEFTVYLPLSRLAPAPGPAEVKRLSAEGAGLGRRIVYIDDDEALVTLVCLLLERSGFEVKGFTEPDRAVQALEAAPDEFDMVVTDFNMPGKSGLDVARVCAQLKPDLDVVIVSGYVTDELRTEAEALGVRAVLYKETSVRDFCATITRLLDTHQQKQQGL